MQIKAKDKVNWFITDQEYHTSVKMKLMSTAHKRKEKMLLLLDITTLNKSNTGSNRGQIAHRKETV
jgi:hypothetical protein